MLNEHERRTLAAFILREKRHRYGYLLDDPQKRSKALDRLNHCRDLDPKYVTWLPSNPDIEGLLMKEGCPDHVYIISCADRLDARTLPLRDALQLVSCEGWGSIVSCIPGELAYYYDEDGERRALLKKSSDH